MPRHFTTVERLVRCDFVVELVVIVLFAREVLRQQLAGVIDRDNKARTGVPQVGKSVVELVISHAFSAPRSASSAAPTTWMASTRREAHRSSSRPSKPPTRLTCFCWEAPR